MTTSKPISRPNCAHFSSGPCAKRPGYDLHNLSKAVLGRSHRSKPGKARLKLAIDKTRTVLGVPADYLIGIVAASDTGAFEMAMWSMLGARGVDVLAWESFGKDWATDVVKQLKLPDTRVLDAAYGAMPDLSKVNFDNDVVFTWNGTTSGVRVPNGDWIAADRGGLTLCDATSAAFAQDLDWPKLDVVTYSWQKVLGGEAQHGMLILSPRAVARLESYKPAWPMPKLFRMTKDGKINAEIFEGATINTPSMLCVEDYLDALTWAEALGGQACAEKAMSDANFAVIEAWVTRTPWVDFLATDPATRLEHERVPEDCRPGPFLSRSPGYRGEGYRRNARKRGRCHGHRRVSRCSTRLANLGGCDGRDGGCESANAMARLGFRQGKAQPSSYGINTLSHGRDRPGHPDFIFGPLDGRVDPGHDE